MDVRNFLQLSKRIATSGQPTEPDFAVIAERGYTAVINLAMSSTVHALPAEGDMVNDLGMTYAHLPVPFDRPTAQHFTLFASLMQELSQAKVWVHCALNLRVSAFMYLYNRIYRHQKADEAAAMLHKIWQPDPVWSSFITQILNTHGLSNTPTD
ncbi:protein tyrosine phosphatase family protein [Microbulbifer guangxiensis]|uniref:protein tyrosine phosphatase family protein n=1 Tax=Microbulbifer guangxiensis TaxID=2904249 RepID=UPI001F22BC39|nr:protein tyrosine phosphatase family protein [Microbulbifer guangxiensis]